MPKKASLHDLDSMIMDHTGINHYAGFLYMIEMDGTLRTVPSGPALMPDTFDFFSDGRWHHVEIQVDDARYDLDRSDEAALVSTSGPLATTGADTVADEGFFVDPPVSTAEVFAFG